MSNAVMGRPVRAVREQRGRAWSAPRIAGAAVLAAWAVLFWFLLLSGRESLYLSTRTAWVVPVGATLLTAASLGRLASARGSGPTPMTPRQAWALGLMVVPVVLLLALPPATLGSFSVGKRTGFAGSGIATGGADATGPLSLLDVAAAQTSKEGQAALAKRAGEQVDFVGFVIRYADTPADEFMLTRYIVTCCVADATIAAVRVVNVPPGSFASNDWVDVRGTIYPLSGREILVDATSIAAVPRPDHPYLTP